MRWFIWCFFFLTLALPQDDVLPPLLFILYTNECRVKTEAGTI